MVRIISIEEFLDEKQLVEALERWGCPSKVRMSPAGLEKFIRTLSHNYGVNPSYPTTEGPTLVTSHGRCLFEIDPTHGGEFVELCY